MQLQTDSDTVDRVVSAGNVTPQSEKRTALQAATRINALQSKKDLKRQEIHFSEDEKISVAMTRNKWLSKIMWISKLTERRVNVRCYDFSRFPHFNRIKVNQRRDKAGESGRHWTQIFCRIV